MTQTVRPRKPPSPSAAEPTPVRVPLQRLLNPLRQVAAVFFKHDVALRRADDGLRLVFEQRTASCTPRPATPADLVARKEEQDLALVRSQLRTLLDDLPETRQAMRHLVFVEKALASKGLKALEKLPLELLQRALEQLEGLVTNWSPVGLATLRSKIAVAVIDREQREGEDESRASRVSVLTDSMILPDDQTMPLPLVEAADDEALAAAYAALGTAAPAAAPLPPAGDLALHERRAERT